MPFATPMGVEVEAAAPDRVVARLLVRNDLCTAGGILHGCAIMALADSLGAIGGFLQLPRRRNWRDDDREQDELPRRRQSRQNVRGETTPVRRGKRTSVWQTKITSEDGKAVALVIQTQMVLFAGG